MNRLLYLLLSFLIIHQVSNAQVGNNMCEGALPFCTGTSYSFPAGTGTPSAQTGPFYSCLTTTPNPAWYYMKIALPGMIQITMHSEPAHDIDFCLWGPFDNQNACGQLTSAKVVDCSYSTAATEVVDIPNAVQGKYYILIITNFSNLPCNIIFSQTGGQGKTDCTILPPAATNDGPLCVGETLHLTAANMNNAVYHWTGPDGWSANVQNPLRTNVQLSMAGQYSLFVTVNGQPSADTNFTNVAVFNKPTATLRGGASLCQGDSTQLTISCQNHPPWNVTLGATGQTPISIPISISPYHLYVHPSVTTTYSITSVSNEICTGVGSGTALVTVNPKPVVDFSSNDFCSGYPTYFFDETTVSGGFPATWHWDFGVGSDTSNLQDPVYTFGTGGTYNVLLKVISNGGCSNQKVKSVVIKPTPVANAGNDKSIPYGTNTTLSGSASGGSGTFSYHWEPANLLVNPDVANPVTVNLSSTTDFILYVTDQGNGCAKSDGMTVTITGGPLGVSLLAEPAAICKGSSTLINAQAGGGGGNYSYSWSSNPAGFTSSLEDVTVQPEVTTTYTVVVNDGFTTVTKFIVITVYPNPVVSPVSNFAIPYGTSTSISGTASGGLAPYSYAWSPANLLTTPNQNQSNTVILTSSTTFTLTVTDGHQCISSSDLLVSLTGGPLAVSPQPEHSPICIGESTVLHPLSAGGSGNYTYTWSTGGNVFSHSSDPTVTPLTTTTYRLQIDDGYTQNEGFATILVNPLPPLHLIPAGAHVVSNDTILACVFDTVTISAANANCTYLWSNGATTPEITSTTTGIAFDMLSYSVDVQNTLTGCKNDASLTIMFTYGECSYGVPENTSGQSVVLYPNPGEGLYFCKILADVKNLKQEVLSVRGEIISSSDLELSPGEIKLETIDLRGYPSGVYFLRLSGTDFFRIVRIVKL